MGKADGKKLMGKSNLPENWCISTILKRVCSVFSIISGFLNAYLLIGKEQYTCWGCRTGVQGSPSNWLKIEKISMGYPWDWFKSPFPWVSHGTDLSHHNPWDTHGNVLSHYSWLKLPWNTIPSYFSWDHFKSSDPRVSPCHRTSPE